MDTRTGAPVGWLWCGAQAPGSSPPHGDGCGPVRQAGREPDELREELRDVAARLDQIERALRDSDGTRALAPRVPPPFGLFRRSPGQGSLELRTARPAFGGAGRPQSR
jgi:hypothetical protein